MGNAVISRRQGDWRGGQAEARTPRVIRDLLKTTPEAGASFVPSPAFSSAPGAGDGVCSPSSRPPGRSTETRKPETETGRMGSS
jgi:hypothetical protein